MTVQANDSVIYKRKRYTLIDVEKGKQIIDCAEFEIPKHETLISSGCWRGYTAEYWITKGKLYGKRYERDAVTEKCLKSKKMYMDYTGSCIIARAIDENAKWYISDFLECYIDYDVALELHFTNGILDEVRDLGEAIKENCLLEQEPFYQSESTDPSTRRSLRENIAFKYLKYEYGFRSYKWRRHDDRIEEF